MNIDIIGAGVGGLATAITIRQLDKEANVVIHEKNKEIGFNPEGRRCGEGFNIMDLWAKWKPSSDVIFNEIRHIELELASKTYKYQRKEGTTFILDRQKFIHSLSKKALDLGVEIQTNDKIKNITDLDSNYIVDASGCPSFFKKKLGLNNGLMSIGYQQTLENSNNFKEDTMRVYWINKDYTGYFWIFPRNPEKKEINVGVGVLINQKPDLKQMLSEFIDKYDIDGEVNYTTGGYIPMGLQKPLIYNNILFVGDAGVGTFPFTGEGIFRAILSGETAGRCIVNNEIDRYKKLINELFFKWNFIGVNFLKLHSFFIKIGPRASNILLDSLFAMNDKSMFIKIES
jgi:flavin-dependent dehydrogenase